MDVQKNKNSFETKIQLRTLEFKYIESFNQRSKGLYKETIIYISLMSSM